MNLKAICQASYTSIYADGFGIVKLQLSHYREQRKYTRLYPIILN